MFFNSRIHPGPSLFTSDYLDRIPSNTETKNIQTLGSLVYLWLTIFSSTSVKIVNTIKHFHPRKSCSLTISLHAK